jgi:hypothetical protein
MSAWAIGQAIGSDVRTIKSDLAVIAGERATTRDFDAERQRLADAARAVEAEAWALYERLPGRDGAGRIGALRTALAAQAQVADAIGNLETADLARRVAVLEAKVDEETSDDEGQRATATRGTPRTTAW